MYRIRFHGRGGQGIKTAAQVLGAAFFHAGYEVQDAPRYGAERRGAPIFAFVRASREAIHERGAITRPDLVVVADDTLVTLPAAGVLQGLDARCVLLLHTAETAELWRTRLRFAGTLLTLPPPAAGQGPDARAALDAGGDGEREVSRYVGAACAGAAARLLGVIPRACLAQAIEDEVGRITGADVPRSALHALAAYDGLAAQAGIVQEGSPVAATGYSAPAWVDVPRAALGLAVPDITAAASSTGVDTGVWRSARPVIDLERCHRCTWVCSTLCPDSAIAVAADGSPRIDYAHCKGCMVCVAVCPPHAIHVVPEHAARSGQGNGT